MFVMQRVSGISQKIVPWLGACARRPVMTCQRCRTVTTRPGFGKVDNGYALLAVPLATFALGTWQVQRLTWKNNMIEELNRTTTSAPIPFPQDLHELNQLEYRKVTLRGEFDHGRELYVSPRNPVADADLPSGLIGGSGSHSGAHVITPFKVADRDLWILVNRGWVRRDRIKPENRPEGQIEGEVALTGVVRKTEPRKPFTPKNDVKGHNFFHRDVEVMAALTDTEPVFLDADRVSTVPGGPVGGQTRVTLRNEHMSYILTWYTLSAATAFMWAKRYLR